MDYGRPGGGYRAFRRGAASRVSSAIGEIQSNKEKGKNVKGTTSQRYNHRSATLLSWILKYFAKKTLHFLGYCC